MLCFSTVIDNYRPISFLQSISKLFEKVVFYRNWCHPLRSMIHKSRVNTFNFLGIKLDENVTWKPHISILPNRISKYWGMRNRLKHDLPLHIMRILYCSLVNSNLLYGIWVWGYKCRQLEKIQKRIIRKITVSKYNAHTEPLFKALDLLKLKHRLNLSTLKLYYRYLHDNLPLIFLLISNNNTIFS